MGFKDCTTYENLKKAYEGELKASAKYRIFGRKARKDGYQQIGNIFEETSWNEMAHAEIWLKLLEGGKIPDTLENLENSCRGESREWRSMYLKFAVTAEEEGYSDIARLFREVAEIERHHDYRFDGLAENIRDNEAFCKRKDAVWVCLNCGYIHYGACAPEICPVCGCPKGCYQINCENY
ncbi:rubrerythrin family protein [Qiania dongpingensis]|uniref:Rubrerythrin family protein n=1 Tax=Qiania dongpingensis TaxID=2763669 RepID=A0A7G9G681_9FIRM|nr:ferritin family protein [Qiania dongpingensis]QNM06313.1 rubrerythrin family protein [Qiania dongpingensis]